MKIGSVFFAMAMAAIAGQASATRYAYCANYDLNGDRALSGIIEIGDSPDDYSAFESVFYAEFRDYRSTVTGKNPSPGGCYARDSIARVHEDWDQDAYNLEEEGKKVVRTGWTGNRPAAVESAGTTPRKSATSSAAVANRAADDAVILEAQKAAAAANARRVADAARNEAENKLKIAKFIEDLKKRGRAQ